MYVGCKTKFDSTRSRERERSLCRLSFSPSLTERCCNSRGGREVGFKICREFVFNFYVFGSDDKNEKSIESSFSFNSNMSVLVGEGNIQIIVGNK